MDNYENNNNNEYTTNLSEDNSNKIRKFDPVAETKKKLILFVVFIVIMIGLKFLLGL